MLCIHITVIEKARLLPKVAALLHSPELLQSTNIARFGPEHLDSFLSAVLPSQFANVMEIPWRPDLSNAIGRGTYGVDLT